MPSTGKNKLSAPSSPWPEDRLRRWLVLITAVGLLAASVIVYWIPGNSQASAQWLSGILAKVSIVLGALWLAFPQVARLQRLRGGKVIFSGLAVLAFFFILRPRYLLYAIPMVATGVSILFSLGWLSQRTGSRHS